jgi:uncharacterized protein with NRDE domain
MCLILFAYKMQKSTPLVVAANRDEFYTRPTRTAHYWENFPELLAGMDLEAGGTWLGVTKSRRFAAVTNRAGEAKTAPVSRGGLAMDFLKGTQSAGEYAASLHRDRYQGFNLILFDGHTLVYVSNGDTGDLRELTPGYYGLSNASLDSDWPKVKQGKEGLERLVSSRQLEPLVPLEQRHSQLVQLLQAELPAPHTSMEQASEYRAGSSFIRGQDYGTRASSCVLVGDSIISFFEQNYSAGGISSEFQLFEIH